MTKLGSRTKLSKLTRIILAPICITLFLAGWVLFNIGQSRPTQEPKYEKKQSPTNKTPQKQDEITIGVIPQEEITVTA
jgi:hypothetical protein